MTLKQRRVGQTQAPQRWISPRTQPFGLAPIIAAAVLRLVACQAAKAITKQAGVVVFYLLLFDCCESIYVNSLK